MLHTTHSPGSLRALRSRTRTLVGLLALASSLFPAEQGGAAELLITNARLVDGTGSPPLDPASILIRDGRIARIGKGIEAPGVALLDAAGATVLPGLVDSHVHLGAVPGSAQRGDSPAERARLGRLHLRAYLACGVTTVLDAGIAPDSAREIQRWLAEGQPGPRFLTLGPMFTPPGGYLSEFGSVATREDVRALMDLAESVGVVGVKVALEKGFGPAEVWPLHTAEIRAAIREEATRRGLPIYVHGSHEDEQTLAQEMGAHALVHIGFWDGTPSDEFVRRTAERGTYVMTTFSIMDAELARWRPERLEDPLVRLVVPEVELATALDPQAGKALSRARMGMISPRAPGFVRSLLGWWFDGDEATGGLLANALDAARRLHEAGTPLVVGSDASNWDVIPYQFHGPSTLRELELLAELGLAPAEILAAATTVPARMLGLEAEIGTVEAGKAADLVIVDGDPLTDIRALRSIRWTLRAGLARTPREWMER